MVDKSYSDALRSLYIAISDGDALPADSNEGTVAGNEVPVDPNIGLSIDQIIERVRVVSRKFLSVELSVEQMEDLINTEISRNYASSKDAKRAHDWCLSEHDGGFRIFRDTLRSADKVCGVFFNYADQPFFNRKAAIEAGVNLTVSPDSPTLPDLSKYMEKRKVLVPARRQL